MLGLLVLDCFPSQIKRLNIRKKNNTRNSQKTLFKYKLFCGWNPLSPSTEPFFRGGVAGRVGVGYKASILLNRKQITLITSTAEDEGPQCFG